MLFVVENIFDPVMFPGSFIEGFEDLGLDVWRQSPSFDGAACHLMRDLFGRARYEIMSL